MNIVDRLERIETLRRDRGLSASMANRLALAGNDALIAHAERAFDSDIAALNLADESASDLERNMHEIEKTLRTEIADAHAKLQALADTIGAESTKSGRGMAHLP